MHIENVKEKNQCTVFSFSPKTSSKITLWWRSGGGCGVGGCKVQVAPMALVSRNCSSGTHGWGRCGNSRV